ncbi:hypothetical protein FOA52_003374 [Chlamydomonas sp. UWO 241]|nr:hypothetical protein FOA52_003374 [Chlamydomonas sp. UWO 241]
MILWLGFIIPLFIFITYQKDFVGINPLWPPHYFYIARRAFGAMQQGNGKVRERDM